MIESFLNQRDEAIVVKLAHFLAYIQIQELFSLNLDKFSKELKKKTPIVLSGLNMPEDIASRYRDLFLSDLKSNHAESVIKEKLFDAEGTWIGCKGKFQEVPALLEALKLNLYIHYLTLTSAVSIFCEKYGLEISK